MATATIGNFHEIYGFDGSEAKIFLDGVEQKNIVFELNEKEGWVNRYIEDDKGNLKIAPNGEEFESEKVYGVVKVAR